MLQIDMKRRYLHTSLKQKSQNFQLIAVMYEHYSYIWHVGMRRVDVASHEAWRKRHPSTRAHVLIVSSRCFLTLSSEGLQCR